MIQISGTWGSTTSYYFEIGASVDKVIDYTAFMLRNDDIINFPRWRGSEETFFIMMPEDVFRYDHSTANKMRWVLGEDLMSGGRVKKFYFTLWYTKHEE